MKCFNNTYLLWGEWTCLWAMPYLWRSEDNLEEFVPSFYRVDPGDETWVIRVSSKSPYPLSHLTNTGTFFLKYPPLRLKWCSTPAVSDVGDGDRGIRRLRVAWMMNTISKENKNQGYWDSAEAQRVKVSNSKPDDLRLTSSSCPPIAGELSNPQHINQ